MRKQLPKESLEARFNISKVIASAVGDIFCNSAKVNSAHLETYEKVMA